MPEGSYLTGAIHLKNNVNLELMLSTTKAEKEMIVVATSDPHETRLIVARAHALHPGIDFVVRTHSDAEAAHLRALGGKVQAVHGERELAVQMARYALRRFGVSATEAEAIAQGLRGRAVVRASTGATSGGGPGWRTRLRDRFRRGDED